MNGFKHNTDGKTKTVEFHAGRIVIYAVLYGIALFFYFFLYGYIQLVLVAVLTAMPAVSVASAVWQSRRCRVRLTVSEKCVTCQEKLEIGILLQNSSVFSSLGVTCRLRLDNTFYGTGTVLTAAVPTVIRGSSSAVLPVVPDRNGIVQITVQAAVFPDFCGLVSIIAPLSLSETVQVLPEHMELQEEEKAGIYSGITGNEEDISKGNDFADTSNIREYIPGDRMKDIHWKLSAKKENLLVKERIRITENRLVIWLAPAGSNEQTDAILRLCYNLIRICTKEGILVILMWQKGREKEASQARILNMEDLRQAFLQVYHSGTGSREEAGKVFPGDNTVPVRTYVHVGLHDNAAGAVVMEHEA